jgi:hypothetical protein
MFEYQENENNANTRIMEQKYAVVGLASTPPSPRPSPPSTN